MGRQTGDHDADNERMEYLGDAVIETVVSDILYHKYPRADEGFLSRIRSNMVCRARLNSISFELGLDQFVVLSSRKDLANSHISGDVLEAFVAAIYLDGGMKRAFKFVERAIANPARIDEALHDSSQTNYKSLLVNLGEQSGVEIIFDTRRADIHKGADGEEINFVSEIKLSDNIIGKGLGRSKKQAEQKAAEEVYKLIDNGTLSLKKHHKEEAAKENGNNAEIGSESPADKTADEQAKLEVAIDSTSKSEEKPAHKKHKSSKQASQTTTTLQNEVGKCERAAQPATSKINIEEIMGKPGTKKDAGNIWATYVIKADHSSYSNTQEESIDVRFGLLYFTGIELPQIAN